MRKRALDLFVAVPLLAVCGPIIAVAFVLATIDTRSCGLFAQMRFGRKGLVVTSTTNGRIS